MTKIIRIKGKRVRPGQILLAIGMILVAMIMIAPFLWVFSASLRTSVMRRHCRPNGFRLPSASGI